MVFSFALFRGLRDRALENHDQTSVPTRVSHLLEESQRPPLLVCILGGHDLDCATILSCLETDGRFIIGRRIRNQFCPRHFAQSREEEQFRQRELELTADLQAGQARLNDLNNQLDTIMQGLEAP